MKISGLEWDDINLEHIIGKHNISPQEIMDICFGPHYACTVKYKRKAVYGQATSGRYLMVVLKRLYDNVFRPITARGMKKEEKRKYHSIMGQD